MAKLISKKYGEKNANRTVQFPLIGVALFDEKGLLEVPDDKVEEFIKITEEAFNFVDSSIELKPGEKVTDEEEIDKEVKEFTTLLNGVDDKTLRSLVSETEDKILIAKAIDWNIERIKEELVKRYKRKVIAERKKKLEGV